MEKIIFRKFFYDILSFFLIVSLSLSLIAWVIQSVNYLDLISSDGHGFKVYFSFVLLNFPKIFSNIIIFSYFISIFYIIQKYQSNNEILIFWTNGISKIRLINFIIKVSIFLTIFQLIATYYVVPKLQDHSRSSIRTSNIDLFTSLITEKKFIDTVKDFTIYVDKIDKAGNLENIFLKDGMNKDSVQIISANSGIFIENGTDKYLELKYGQILDVARNIDTDDIGSDANFDETKIIKFQNFVFNLSNFVTKTTTFPKIQELDSKVLIDCVNTFLFGNKMGYTLSFFDCSEGSSIKSAKELFDRSFKQIYIIVAGLLASILIFFNDKNPNYKTNRIYIFLLGLICIILSEIQSEYFVNSITQNTLLIFLPFIIFIILYLTIFNFYRKLI